MAHTLPFAVCLLLASAQAPNPPADDAVEARLVAIGGEVRRDPAGPAKPIIGVSLSGLKNVDSALGVLEELRHLKRLDLAGSDLTDKGMALLAGLRQFRQLNLTNL